MLNDDYKQRRNSREGEGSAVFPYHGKILSGDDNDNGAIGGGGGGSGGGGGDGGGDGDEDGDEDGDGSDYDAEFSDVSSDNDGGGLVVAQAQPADGSRGHGR